MDKLLFVTPAICHSSQDVTEQTLYWLT